MWKIKTGGAVAVDLATAEPVASSNRLSDARFRRNGIYTVGVSVFWDSNSEGIDYKMVGGSRQPAVKSP